MKHVENIEAFGEEPVVTLNRFHGDSDAEIEVVPCGRACASWRLPFAVSEAYTAGGAGAVALAETVMRHAERRRKPFTPLYSWTDPIKEKLEKVAHTMYGAGSVLWEHQGREGSRRDVSVLWGGPSPLHRQDAIVAVRRPSQSGTAGRIVGV